MGNSKDAVIIFRLSREEKEEWKAICKEKGISSLTSLIIASVKNRMLENEREELLTFIEKQDNIFLKIQNNINQFAKYANTRKFIDTKELVEFNQKLEVIEQLKEKQNKIFEKIYTLIANDDS